MYDDGCGLPENKVLSAYYLTQALNNGEGGAQMLLGFLDEEIGDTAIDQKNICGRAESLYRTTQLILRLNVL
ncbi:hypothetical protein JCM19053_1839 [Vibrio sp. JCM 19053]|nr:hypothetical protein JCM19053_1839 [Vibrio sp. JCM 19053]